MRVLAIAALIVLAGVAQYGYVWLRTIQHAEYLEATAHTVREFVDVLQAKQFQGITFADSPWVVLTRRVPAVASEVRDELGSVAVAAALVGCAALLWRRPRLGVLLGLGAIGPVLLLATLGDVAVGAILLAGEVPAWLLAGVGMDVLRTALSTMAPRWLSIVVAGCLATGVPVAHMARNFAFNNHRHDTYYTDYFRALFQWIPSRAGFIDEEYILNNMVQYQRYSTGRRNVRVAVPTDIATIESLRRQQFDLFAFDRGRAALEGLAVFRPIPPLAGQTLEARCRTLPAGRLVILAGSATQWPEAASIGLTRSYVPRRRAIVVAARGSDPPIVTPASPDATVEFQMNEPMAIPRRTAPVSFRVESRGSHARIFVDGELTAETDHGICVVELGAGIEAAYTLRAESGLQAPLDMSLRPLYELQSVNPPERCTDLPKGRWTPLSDPGREARLLGRIDNRERIRARWQFYLASPAGLPVRMGESYGGGELGARIDQFDQRPSSRLDLLSRLRTDGLAESGPLLGAPAVTRVEMAVDSEGPLRLFRLELGGRPLAALGRVMVDLPVAARVRACGVPGESLAQLEGVPGMRIPLGPGGDWFFGPGWSPDCPVPSGFERLTTAPEAVLLVPLDRPHALQLGIRLAFVSGTGEVGLSVNGRPLIWRVLGSEMSEVNWEEPATSWAAGVNTVTLRTRDNAQRLRVRRIALQQEAR